MTDINFYESLLLGSYFQKVDGKTVQWSGVIFNLVDFWNGRLNRGKCRVVLSDFNLFFLGMIDWWLFKCVGGNSSSFWEIKNVSECTHILITKMNVAKYTCSRQIWLSEIFLPSRNIKYQKNIAVAKETNVDAEPKEIIIKKISRYIIYSKDICCYRDMLNRWCRSKRK